MWLRKIILVIYCLLSGCASADKAGASFASLMVLDDTNRAKACLAFPPEERVELFFQTQKRHHEYFGFDQCFASSPTTFLNKLKSEILKRGTVEGATHYIMVLRLSQQQGKTSGVEIKAMELTNLCKSLANESPSGNPSQCIKMAEDLLR